MDRQNEIMMKEIPAQIRYMGFNEAISNNVNSENGKEFHYLKKDQIIKETDEIEENNNDMNVNDSNERYYLNEIYNNNYINENENEIEEEMRDNNRNKINMKLNNVNNNLYINNRAPLQMKKIDKNNENINAYNNYEYNEILHEDQAVYITDKSPRFNKNNLKEKNNIYKSQGIVRETKNYQLYTSNYSKTGKNVYIPKSHIGSEKTTFMENKNEEIESIIKNNNNKKKDLKPEIMPEIKNTKIINAIPLEKYIEMNREVNQENQTFKPNKIENQSNNNQYNNINNNMNYKKKKKRIIYFRRHKPIVIQHFDVQIIQEQQENYQDCEYQEKIYNYKNTNNIIKENEENKVPPVQNIYNRNSNNFYRNQFYYYNNSMPLGPYFNKENININRYRIPYTPKQTLINVTPMRTINEPYSPNIIDIKVPYNNRYYNNERFRTLTPPNPPKRRHYELENNRRYFNNGYNNDTDMRRKNSYSLYPQRKEALIIYEDDDINNQYNRGQRIMRNNY